MDYVLFLNDGDDELYYTGVSKLPTLDEANAMRFKSASKAYEYASGVPHLAAWRVGLR